MKKLKIVIGNKIGEKIDPNHFSKDIEYIYNFLKPKGISYNHTAKEIYIEITDSPFNLCLFLHEYFYQNDFF